MQLVWQPRAEFRARASAQCCMQQAMLTVSCNQQTESPFGRLKPFIHRKACMQPCCWGFSLPDVLDRCVRCLPVCILHIHLHLIWDKVPIAESAADGSALCIFLTLAACESIVEEQPLPRGATDACWLGVDHDQGPRLVKMDICEAQGSPILPAAQ